MYKQIISQHLRFQEDLLIDPDSIKVDEIKVFIRQIRKVGSEVADVEQRDQLRKVIRQWAAFVFEKTDEYPAVQLAPLPESGDVDAPMRLSRLIKEAGTTPIIIGVIIVILVFVAGAGIGFSLSIRPTNTATYTPLPELIITPKMTPSLTPTKTSHSLTPIPTLTLSNIQTSTATQTPSLTVTNNSTPTNSPHIQLIEPVSETVYPFGGRIRLEWLRSIQLTPNELFAVRVWRDGENPESIASTRDNVYVIPSEELGEGSYNWSIGVFKVTEEGELELVGQESGTEQFRVAPQALPPAPKPTPTLPFELTEENRDPISIANRVTIPPSIDGDLNEWGSLLYNSDLVTFGGSNWSGPADASAEWRILWDDEYLYLGIRSTDDLFVQTERGIDLFKGDSIDLKLDIDLEGDFNSRLLNEDDFQLGFSPGNFEDELPETFLWRPFEQEGAIPNVLVAVQQNGEGFQLEAAVPWSTFGIEPSPLTFFGFALNVSDNDNFLDAEQQTMVSNAPKHQFSDPTSWGTLVLIAP